MQHVDEPIKDLQAGAEKIDKWWHWIRPYWHIASFLILFTSIVTLNWAKVSAYDGRIATLEVWQVSSSRLQLQQEQDIAVMKQQVADIHDYLMPKK